MTQELNHILARLFNLQVGGFTYTHKLTGAQIGVTSATYSSGVTLGTTAPISCELLRGQTGTGVLQSIVIQDLSKQNGAIDVLFFDSNPSSTIFTDNAALDIDDADLPKLIGSISITSSDYASYADNSVATKSNLGLTLKSLNTSAQSKIWVALVSRDTKTYVANEVSIAIGILQD